jgi:hypothetical protein
MRDIVISTARGVGSIVKGYDPQVTQMQSLPFSKATYGTNGTDTVGIKPGMILRMGSDGDLVKAYTPTNITAAVAAADLYMAMDDSHDHTANELGQLTVVRLNSGLIIETSEYYTAGTFAVGDFLVPGVNASAGRGYSTACPDLSANIVTAVGITWVRNIGSIYAVAAENKLYGRNTVKIAITAELVPLDLVP